MKLYKKVFFACLISLLALAASAQKNFQKHNLFGIQIKPIVPVSFLDSREFFENVGDVRFTISQKFGNSFGLVVRRNMTNKLSFETGLNLIQRNFDLTINDSLDVDHTTDFRIIAYEIPVLFLVYLQMFDNVYMNNALGFSFEFYPTTIFTSGEFFAHSSSPRSWSLPGAIANVGFEYRTPKKGTIYVGATYKRPFYNIYRSKIQYTPVNLTTEGFVNIVGSIFTIDLRYFFPVVENGEKIKDY